jgi:RHS repeat-associated protein
VTTGAPIDARFPGQWFQTEAGLYQNWMRDYDPTTGRYIEADPLGLIDGASVYGYAMQNPGRYTDPRGESSSMGPRPPSPPQADTPGGLCQAGWKEDCHDDWQDDQNNCIKDFAAHKISDLQACIRRANDVFNHCMNGGGGPGPTPWTSRDEDVPKAAPKKPKGYGQPPPKPGVTSRNYGAPPPPSMEGYSGFAIAGMILLGFIGGLLAN